jgi:serine/threonine-protein kinase
MRFRRHVPRGFYLTAKFETLTARLAGLRRLPTGQRLLVLLAAFLATFVAGYLLAALVVFPAPIFASATAVPRVLGMPRQEAERTLAEVGLAAGEVDEATHPTLERSAIVWQDPPPGVAVSPRSAVNLTVSIGPQRVPGPDLTGYDATLAGQLIQAAGLRIRSIDSTQAPVPRGVVVNTRPPAGSTLLPGSGVTLVVSVGAPTITVPDLTGLEPEDAAAVLELVGLTMGTSMRRTSSASDPGTIIEQSPAPGTLSAPGTAVNITVAR